MNVTLTFANLFLTRPSVDAAPAAVADWYDAKAALHEAIAEQESGEAAAHERAYAKAARDRARALRGDQQLPSAA